MNLNDHKACDCKSTNPVNGYADREIPVQVEKFAQRKYAGGREEGERRGVRKGGRRGGEEVGEGEGGRKRMG